MPLRFLLGSLLCLSLLPSQPVLAQGQPPPDLNLLRSRVQEYWSLLQAGAKVRAMEYVLPERRDLFLSRKEMRFVSFVLRGITFQDDPGRARVRVEARVGPPYLPRFIDWPVEETYVFREGNWYLEAEVSRVKDIFGPGESSSTEPEPTPADQEGIQGELERFELGDWHLDLGELAQGQSFSRALFYHNAGQASLLVEIGGVPPWLGFRHRSRFSVPPGGKGTLPLVVDTTQLDGPFRGKVSLRIRSGPVELERELTVEGRVRSPVTVSPWPVVLQAGRSSQAIGIRNNLQEEIQVAAVVLPAPWFRVVPREIRQGFTIPAGESFGLELTWDPARIPERWAAGTVQLTLARPVDGRSVLFIPVRPEPAPAEP